MKNRIIFFMDIATAEADVSETLQVKKTLKSGGSDGSLRVVDKHAHLI